MPKPPKDYTGNKYGRWTVLGRHCRKRGVSYWMAKCECGDEHSVVIGNLVSGTSTQCRDCSTKASLAKRKKWCGCKY